MEIESRATFFQCARRKELSTQSFSNEGKIKALSENKTKIIYFWQIFKKTPYLIREVLGL